MNKVFLGGRITSEITTFGTDSKGGASFTLVTSKPVIRDGEVQKDANGYTETYDQFHTIKAFGGLGRSVAKHKKKGDMVEVQGRLHYSKWTDREGVERYAVEIVAEEVLFL